jgi:uncharacterized membrane protein
MTTVEKTIEVNEPVRTVYNQWTQFEEFPNFMEGVEKVVQLDDTRLHWVAEIAGVKREWDAKIEEQLPDKRIAWRSTTGEKNAGTVNFEPVSQNQTKVTLRLDYEPDDVVEKAGASLGFLSKQVERDLERFKNFIENRTVETGAWRGEVR